jgi:hypothetical protein
MCSPRCAVRMSSPCGVGSKPTHTTLTFGVSLGFTVTIVAFGPLADQVAGRLIEFHGASSLLLSQNGYALGAAELSMRLAFRVIGMRRIFEIEHRTRACSVSSANCSSVMPGRSAATTKWMPSTE